MRRYGSMVLLLAVACGGGPHYSDQRVVRKQIESVTSSRLVAGGKGGVVSMTEPAFVLHSIEGKACTVSSSEYYAVIIGRNYFCDWQEP